MSEPESGSGSAWRSTDTIFAIASGHGRAAIAVIRISGAASGPALAEILGGSRRPEPRRASLRRLVDPATGAVLDQALVLWLPGPATFTGEDQVELHIHGGTAVRAAVVRALAGLPGLRAAEPGEFTRRAFLNGRLDLTAVEGLADLIDAETEAQRRQAVRQLEGELATRVASWRERLVDALAACEAALDFSDEEDVPADVASPAERAVAEVGREIAAALAGAERGERLREGLTVVIAGAPNAGKSTLLNALARRDVAIVSPVAGTTRDAIEVRCDLHGLPVTFVDTAGLRASDDPLERQGMARAEARIAAADLVLWLRPSDDGLAESAVVLPPGTTALEVLTKADLLPPGEPGAGLAVSAVTGAGLDALLDAIQRHASAALEGDGDAIVTRERHRSCLTEVVSCLDRAGIAWQAQAVELVAEDLRLALRALGRLTGRVDVEEILDRIFSSFCIGK